MATNAKWTVLTYIAAHNNLDLFGKRSRQEILGVGSSSDVVHGILYDSPVGAARYVIGEPGLVEHQEQLGSFDSGDPDQLIATAQWLFQEHPAERYGLVLWSHGSGWQPGEIEAISNEVRPEPQINAAEKHERASAPASRCLFRSTLSTILKPDKPAERAILFDDGTGHSLDTLELARVASAIATIIGQRLDLLGMDACLMANVEVAYEIRKDVCCLVASEELVPGHSWPYGEIFGELRANPDLGAAELAKLAVERYVSFYKTNPPSAGDVTKVAFSLDRIEDLVCAADRLAGALRLNMDRGADALWQVQRTAEQHETNDGKRKPSKFDFHLWDLNSLAIGLAHCDASSTGIRGEAANTSKILSPGVGSILAEGHRGAWFEGIGGASVYLVPPGRQRISPSYTKLAFAKDTQWDEMLFEYHQQLK
jgi:hypothetical protein